MTAKLNDKLRRVGRTLSAVCAKTYHYKRPTSLAGCIVWQEDAEEGSFHVGNHLAEQQLHGTIDYFTKTEFDETIDNIQAALESNHSIGWRLSSIQYEDDTGLIHYEWDFWVS